MRVLEIVFPLTSFFALAVKMLSIQQVVSMSLVSSLAAQLVQPPAPAAPSQSCGGTLRGPYGIIQTPNFPNAFPVPIKCKWIISHDLVNGTISIYFTQQYTTSGLSFTEYMYYDDSYKLGERRAFQVTEENITKVKSIQVQSPVLVVELSLSALEGTQLRALGLLSVFGVNITYAVTPPAPAPPPASAATAAAASCSALECRLLGHCYATHDYQSFFCSCFEGYSGPDCGVSAACDGTSNICKHGGTCRQMGPAAVDCLCAPGFTGDFCESHDTPPDCSMAECAEGCRNKTKCDCNAGNNDNVSALARFETRVQVLNDATGNVSHEIANQITEYLTVSSIVLEDDIEILNMSAPESDGVRSVLIRIWAAQSYADALQTALTFFSSTSSRSKPRMLPATLHVDMHPALSGLTLTLNQRREIWEGSEFALSCTAYGSTEIAFTWYKDGIKINLNGTTRNIWIRTIKEYETNQITSTVEVSRAKDLDNGRWSCAADDTNRRRCRAIWLTVLKPPDIRLIPSALTINKGDNVSITCLTDAWKSHESLGFSWARDRTLFRLAPGRAVWEDLYPAGSVLKLYNVQKSGEYRCQVTSVAGTTAKAVTLWALGVNDEFCEAGASHGQLWPRTAPGAHAMTDCPPGYSGHITRFCEPKTIQHGVIWRLPDFSQCISSQLKELYDEFILISDGYSWNSVANVTRRYESVLRSLPIHPGEGSVPLRHTREILNYLLSKASRLSDKTGSVEHLLKIYDTLLKHSDNFLDEEKVYELQKAVVQAAGMKDNLEMNLHEFSVMSKAAREYNVATFKLQPSLNFNEKWYIASVGVELARSTRNAVIVAARYNNLAARLPSLKSSIEFRGGAEMEYLIASQHIQLSASGDEVNPALSHTVTLIFSHIHNYSAIVSKLACGRRSSSEPRYWSTKACEVRIPEPSNVACQCHGLGTFALFTVARSTLTHTEKDLRGVVKVTVGVGGALCLAATALQMLGLLPNKKARLPVLLKAATAGTHSAAMFTLLECDSRQEECCAGAWGWVCALCWCAGSAALCAQPLLLQAELAGRGNNAPAAAAVALLAGVCTLSWLTARLWGGAPLQLGTAAQVICAASCTLLVVLCFALAVCTALRLRTINHKIPAERIKYLKDRRAEVRHTLVLVLTTSAAQAAGVAYVQPGERHVSHVAALAVAAIINGIAMVVCYVFCDEECMTSARRALLLAPQRDWEDSPAGDTSLSLYIKQGGEVDSRGGVDIIESSSSRVSPTDSYWRAPGFESSDRIHRRQSETDTRADIVRCVEYAEISRHRPRMTRAVCDLVPRAALIPPDLPPPAPLTPPPHDHCTVCTRSTPDVSIQEAPIKSCLKKSNLFSSSTSLPSMEVVEDTKSLDIDQVNRDWNKAYDNPDTEKVLNKISCDLDFLLNRTLESDVEDEIEEAPT